MEFVDARRGTASIHTDAMMPLSAVAAMRNIGGCGDGLMEPTSIHAGRKRGTASTLMEHPSLTSYIYAGVLLGNP
eukprot:scaffold227870_cov37-Cyclotella_meneghiniana.AAC.5